MIEYFYENKVCVGRNNSGWFVLAHKDKLPDPLSLNARERGNFWLIHFHTEEGADKLARELAGKLPRPLKSQGLPHLWQDRAVNETVKEPDFIRHVEY